ncbi:17785_t:CDS:2, partial [Racocetra fulgida]
IEDITGNAYILQFTADILDKEKFLNDVLKNVNNNLLLGCARFEFSDKDIKDLKGTISGAWSDGSKEWTPERMIQLNYRFGDDGTFWMCYDDFLNYWDMIYKCRLFDSIKLPAVDYVIIPHENQEPKQEKIQKLRLKNVKENDDKEKKDEWELQLGLRVYSKCAGIKLEGLPGEFPKKKDKKEEKAEEKDLEVDTKVINPKDDEKKDDE